jgi:hypothetical protein
MSSDSTDQWVQAGTGRMNDWHPVFHTFVLRLARDAWNTPASVAIAQIVALALLVGVGLSASLRAGVPRLACWVASCIFALTPVTATMVITVWKDVPFAICAFAVIVLLHVTSSEPRVIARRWFWSAFVASNAGALLFRHNGLPVVVGAFAGLLLLAPAARWRAAVAIVAAFGVAFGVRTAIFRSYDVPPPVPSKGYLLLGLVAAHVSARTPLLENERALLSRIRPLEDGWAYNCQSVDPTLYDGHLRVDVLAAHDDEMPSLAARLTMRAPRVTLAYEACRSSFLWRVNAGGGDFIYGPALGFESDSRVTTIYDAPGAPRAAPVLPGLQRVLVRLVRATLRPSLDWLFWRPAFTMYLLLLAAVVSALRQRRLATIAVVLPIVLHTAALALSIPAPQVRYQYPLFLSAFLLVPSWTGACLRRAVVTHRSRAG